ncbi:MAG: alkaline phosphatase [Steroidobacteraceae bacterium]
MRRPLTALLALASLAPIASAKEGAGADYRIDWMTSGQREVTRRLEEQPLTGRARNVILFIGDGMGISTITAARILEGQLRGESGEDNALSFEQLPYLALSKTYSNNQQVSDSAPTATAMVTGVKANDGAISVDSGLDRDEADLEVVTRHALPTLLEQAEARGMATGIVTTARITHATPAVNYAHIGNRDWETDRLLPAGATVRDIAAQLVEAQRRYGIEVVMGGGRAMFLPAGDADPEYPGRSGTRLDGRRLHEEWVAARPDSAYVWNRAGFEAIDADSTRHLLGLFEPSHMLYEEDRAAGSEPSLAEMTGKALDILERSEQGYYLMVEAGRVDHAHHAGNAFRALKDSIALSDAVRAALSRVDLRDTLVIVTADHSHVFTIAGYPERGNPILGLARQPGSTAPRLALDGRPYTTLGYANGRGYARLATGGDTRYGVPPAPGRHLEPDWTNETEDEGYHQEALVPLESETHGGEDVAIYAGGPWSHLFRGVMEQHGIYHVIRHALGW